MSKDKFTENLLLITIVFLYMYFVILTDLYKPNRCPTTCFAGPVEEILRVSGTSGIRLVFLACPLLTASPYSIKIRL